MNDTKIEWATMTWNPVTGCNRGCHYCYARGIARRFGGQIGGHIIKANPMLHDLPQPLAVIRKGRKIIKAPFPFGFEPTFHRYRLDEPLQKKKPQNIFVSSMGDLFGPWIPDEWIQAVFNACKQAPQHRYLFLTKYPARYTALAQRGNLPTDSNFWYGSTATNPGTKFWWSTGHNTFVSFEPLLSQFEPAEGKGGIKRIGWAIIGAMSGAGKVKYQPKKEWVDSIVDEARAAGGNIPYSGESLLRSRRDVWTVSTAGFKGAHFATFPEKLVEPCILAGCQEGGIVLDPFFGSGTTGAVAVKKNRRYIGIEINPEYAELSRNRIAAIEEQGIQLKMRC